MYSPTRFSRKFLYHGKQPYSPLYIPVTSLRSSACFNTTVSTEEVGIRVLAVGGETEVFVVVVAGGRL